MSGVVVRVRGEVHGRVCEKHPQWVDIVEREENQNGEERERERFSLQEHKLYINCNQFYYCGNFCVI